jgi:hypothetical protein
MKFEVDLIRYVVDLAIARRCYIRSKDLNADWLPFHTVLEVFHHVCHKLKLAKEVETRCYKALLKMSSSHERHLTWAYKVQNISKYLPAVTQTHSASHTTSSWTRHLTQHNSLQHASLCTGQPKSKKGTSSSSYGDYGLNLGRLSERSGPGSYFWQQTSSPSASQPQSDYTTLRKIMQEIYEEEEEQPAVNRSTNANLTPPAEAVPTVAHDIPRPSDDTPATPYYRHYVPTARWTAQGVPVSPITPAAGTPAPPTPSPHAPSAWPTPPAPPIFTTPASSSTARSSKINTNGGPFADEELLAMHARVAAIEAEARRTRELLANIAYLKETSMGARMDGYRHFEEATSVDEEEVGHKPSSSEHEKVSHQYHVQYGEIPLSPYLKGVLHLPRAMIATDTATGVSPRPATPGSSDRYATYDRSPSSLGGGTASSPPSRFTFSPRAVASSESVHRPAASHTAQRASNPPVDQHLPSHRSRALSSPRSSEQARTTSSAQGSKPRSPTQQDDFSSALRCSAAMRKYLELTSHRTAGVLEEPWEHNREGRGTTRYSPPAPGVGSRSRSPHHRAATAGERAPSPHASRRSPIQARSPAQQYHNTCRTQHARDADVTVIDSRIDEVLGDSLNIEEKDGRVYVHFQSKFLLD